MTISDDTFYGLVDYVEEAISNGTAPKRDGTLGVFTRFFGCYGMYIPLVEKIIVDSNGTLEEEAWVYLHEAGHWAIDKHKIRASDEDVEQACNDIAFIVRDRMGGSLYKLI